MKNLSIDLKTYNLRCGGIGRYTIALCSRLNQNKYNFHGICGPQTNNEGYKLFKNTINYNINSTIVRSYCLSPNKLFKKKIDIHHSMDNSSLSFKRNKKIKTIATIFDLIVFNNPEFFTLKHRIVCQYMISSAIKDSDHVITISENVKQMILNHFPKISPNKVSVILLGSDFVDQKNCSKSAEIFHSLKLPKDYIVSLGTYEPRKNIKRLIDAFLLLKQDKNYSELGLVLIGGKGWLDSGIPGDMDLLNKNKIYPLGFLDDEIIQTIIKKSLLFVYPSIIEGFGLPALEAMSLGTPVVLSNTSSMPEVGGDAAIYINPFSVESIFENIRNVIDDKEMRDHFALRGINQSKKFTWDKTARETEKIYDSI